MTRRPKTSRKEVPLIKRAEMYGMHKGGASYALISREYSSWTIKTVENVCKQVGERENQDSSLEVAHDLNLIEMIWKKVKNMIYRAHSELRISNLRADSLKKEIEKVVFEA